MPPVLITGCSGFLGGAVATSLSARGHPIIGVDPVEPKAPFENFVRSDLSDVAQIEAVLREFEIKHVVHAGGISGPMVFGDRPADTFRINVGGSLNLLLAAVSSGVESFVYCSSMVAGPASASAGLTEIELAHSPYAYSKAAVDLVLCGLSGRVGTRLCSLRFGMIYGPGRVTLSGLDELLAAALEKKELVNTPTMSSFAIYIDDAVDVVAASCFATGRQLVYNVAFPEQLTVLDARNAIDCALNGVEPVLQYDATSEPALHLDLDAVGRDFASSPKICLREGVRRLVRAKVGGTPFMARSV
ncbi:MAG: NAD-dependent epimerase/dehydratase family protein [Pyrinomonadaceae bacterium]